MKTLYFKLKFQDGTFKIVKGFSTLGVIKKYDLATREHLHTRIYVLAGEELAIAIANDQEEE